MGSSRADATVAVLSKACMCADDYKPFLLHTPIHPEDTNILADFYEAHNFSRGSWLKGAMHKMIQCCSQIPCCSQSLEGKAVMLMHSSPEAAYYCFVMIANDVFRSYLSLIPQEQLHHGIVST